MRKKNILVIDDDKIILDSLCEFLSLEGFQTSGAETVKSALAKLEEENYCLVLTDVNLPDGDGLELLDIIKQNYPQTVAIVITGYGTIDSAVKAIKKGAYDYLTKPIIDDELRLAVEQHYVSVMIHHQLMNDRAFELLDLLLTLVAGNSKFRPSTFHRMGEPKKLERPATGT